MSNKNSTQVTSQQIIELETKIAFMELSIEQLNDVIIKQQKMLDSLQAKITQLDSKIEQESQYWSQNNNPVDEKPPHY